MIVGRVSEQQQLAESLQRAARAPGGAIVIRGEAGIGKSALFEAGLEACRQNGWMVLSARAEAVERHLPYAVLSRAVAGIPDEADGALRALAAVVVDAMDVASVPSLSAVHRTAVRFFAAARQSGPTVLAVDDVPHVDDDTIALVSALLLRSEPAPLILLVTQRKPDAEAHRLLDVLLERLNGDATLATIDVGPLGATAVGALISAVVGCPPDPEFVDAVAAGCSGNPLFVREVLAGLQEAEAIVVEDGICRLQADSMLLSSDRRTALLQRVLRVDDAARTVAAVVAVLGAAGLERLALIEELSAQDAAAVRSGFDQLVRKGVLLLDALGAYRFSHELVRDALYQDVGPAQRWQWHRTAADWLARQPITPQIELERATHVAETAVEGDAEALRTLSRAAEITCKSAPRSSVPWFSRAVAVCLDDHPDRGPLLARFARALFLAGRPRDAAEVGRTALAQLPPGPLRTRTMTLVMEGMYETAAVAEALALVESERSVGPSTLHLLGLAGNLQASVGRFEEAESAARETEERLLSAAPTDQVVALSHLAHIYYMLGELNRLPSVWSRLEAGLAAVPDTVQLGAHVTASYIHALVGDREGYVASVGNAQSLLAASGWTLYGAELAVAEAHNAHLAGDWDRVFTIAANVSGGLEEAEAYLHLGLIRALEADLLANRGKWRQAREAASSTERWHPVHVAQCMYALAGVEVLSGSAQAAREILTAELQRPGLLDQTRALLLSRLIEVEMASGDRDTASEALGMLREIPHDRLPSGIVVACAIAEGIGARDGDALRAVSAFSDQHGIVFGSGRSRLALGELGVDVEGNLSEAYSIFHRLGADPWRRRVSEELRRRGLKVPRRRSQDGGLLTETETQVARLVQQGRSNRDIAQTMSLSVKTIDAYLTRIYAKAKCTSRLELARALDAGLLD